MTTILIAEDHVLVRQGLKMLLSVEDGLEVVAETGDGDAVEQLVQDMRPDLVLLDLDLPNCHGTKIATAIKARFSETKILVITGNLQPDAVRRALAAGADGYVPKHEDSTELLLAIREVLEGRQYMSPNIAALFQQDSPDFSLGAGSTGTPREHEIMRLIAKGLSNDEIADALNRSVLTVRKHRQNLMVKLGLRNAAEITKYVMQNDLDQSS